MSTVLGVAFAAAAAMLPDAAAVLPDAEPDCVSWVPTPPSRERAA